MGRLEAFALGNKPGPSFLDAIGNAMGYAWILLAVSLYVKSLEAAPSRYRGWDK